MWQQMKSVTSLMEVVFAQMDFMESNANLVSLAINLVNYQGYTKYSNKHKTFTECDCQNSLEGNICDVSTGQCGPCKLGFFGDFCKGK